MKKHITLFGSMIFLEKMKTVASTLESYGYTVTCPGFTQEELDSGATTFMDYVDSLGGVEKVLPDNPIWNIKREAIFGYKDKIDKADAVLVCNFDKGDKKNPIGDNTFLEMGYAFFMRKKIVVLQGPPYGDEKIEEVLGMTPLFLYNDLQLITSHV